MIVPISIVTTNQENRSNEITLKDNKVNIKPVFAPSKDDRFKVPGWIKVAGSFKVQVISETTEKISFSVDLDTMGAWITRGARVYIKKLDKKIGKFEQTNRIAIRYENGKYGRRPWYEKDLKDGYREFTLDKQEEDEIYKFQLYVGTFTEGGLTNMEPSIEENIPFKISKFMKDPATLTLEDMPEWIKRHGLAKFNVVSDSFEKLKLSVDLDTNRATLKEGGAIVEELIQDKDGNYNKTGRIVAKYEQFTNYSPNGENGYREFSIDKEEYKDVNYKFQVSVAGGYNDDGTIMYLPSFEFTTSTKAVSTDPTFLSIEETPGWIKENGSAKFNVISEDSEKIKFSIDLDTNKAILKASAIIEELIQDENGQYKKTGRILGYYNLWNEYGREGLSGYREFTIYKDKSKNVNYKFQLSIGGSYDNSANVVYTPTFEFLKTIESKK